MSLQSGRAIITSEELSRLIDSEEHRRACVTYAAKQAPFDIDMDAACVALLDIARRARDALGRVGADSVTHAADFKDGAARTPAYAAVRSLLEQIRGGLEAKPTVWYPWSTPNEKHPARGLIAAEMVRCALLSVTTAQRAEIEAQREANRKEREAYTAQVNAFVAEQQRQRRAREEEAERQAAQRRKAEAERKRTEAAKRRGTCGITFAGASMRFESDGDTVFMYRQDVRSVRVVRYARPKLAIVDSAGGEFEPDLTGSADDAYAEVCDWRWRASAEWEKEHGPPTNGGRGVIDDEITPL